MQLSDKTYNIVKWFVSIFLPALATLIGTIGKAINWQQTDLTLTILGAVTVFLGAIMLHSTAQYNKGDE